MKGDELSSAQIRTRFNLASPTAAIRDLRYAGHQIALKETTNSKGTTVNRYSLGATARRASRRTQA
jgi:hypothetical protein